MIDREIGVFGAIAEVCAALQVLSRFQQKLTFSRIVVITTNAAALRIAMGSSFREMEIVVESPETFTFELRPFSLVLNLSSKGTFFVFEAAIRAIPVVSVRSSNMTPIVVSEHSGYVFSYQDLDALERILSRIAIAPEEADKFALEAHKRIVAWCGQSYLLRRYKRPSSSNGSSQARTLVKAALLAALPHRYLLAGGSSQRAQFALTFDDGPDPATTPALLATLQKHEVKATFFLVGNRAEQYPELTKEIANQGHEIGSHSFSHPHFERLSMAQATREISTARCVLEDITGQACRVFRPPFGKLSPQSLLPAWLHKQRVVLWTVDLKDYSATEAAEIQRKATAQRFVNGDIILYHGISDAGVEGLPSVIQAAKGEGRTGVPVSCIV